MDNRSDHFRRLVELGYSAMAALRATLSPARAGPAGRRIAVALQGGGAHGAFTWGVLDRLLEAGIRIEAASGSSAGAFNAVFMAHGLLDGGADGARAALAHLWDRIGAKAAFSPLRPNFLDQLGGGNMENSARVVGFDLFTRLLSPYQFNPLDMNPLRDLLAETIDFERLQSNRRIRLLIAATDVETGHARIFRTREITADVVLASATLPWLHHAVAIGDRHYWDGGFTANPPIMPLIEETGAREVVLVRLDTGETDSVPLTARAIHARLNQIMFTAPLNRDLDQLADLQRLAQQGALRGAIARRLAAQRLQVIEGGDILQPYGQFSKLTPERDFLRDLCAHGRERGETWLAALEDAEFVVADDEPVPQAT
ncbi:MAG: patatin-like phospholipase family protein [Rhodospirillales bacterium]|nr:MAG: patatin-like phospholipase family protein [Rhodospirillales bacterium]